MKKTLAVTIVVFGIFGFSTSLFAKAKKKSKSAKTLKRYAVLTPSMKTKKKSAKTYKRSAKQRQLMKAKRQAKNKRKIKVARLSAKKARNVKKNASWDQIDFYLLKMGHKQNGGNAFHSQK